MKEKIITGNGKTLQKEVNRWLNQGWKMTRIDICKQFIVDNESVLMTKDDFEEAIKNNKPLKIKIKGNSIQNSLMFYDYFLITLSKEEENLK